MNRVKLLELGRRDNVSIAIRLTRARFARLTGELLVGPPPTCVYNWKLFPFWWAPSNPSVSKLDCAVLFAGGASIGAPHFSPKAHCLVNFDWSGHFYVGGKNGVLIVCGAPAASL